MSRSIDESTLRSDALAIWQAGVVAVDSARLVQQCISTWTGGLTICGEAWRATKKSRICVVGAGKAGAGMVAGLEMALGSHWLSRTSGWVNVPNDCLPDPDAGAHPVQRTDSDTLKAPLAAKHPSRIHLHGARPAGVNEPTAAGVEGTREILKRVKELGPDDLCLVLISGGGSALLPAPAAGLTLEDKQRVTRSLMRSGASIDELNRVRRELSEVKGGGLLRACRAGRLISLVISDVMGDPLETIASGPTVDFPPDPKGALDVLKKFASTERVDEENEDGIPERVLTFLNQRIADDPPRSPPSCRWSHHLIGTNRTAVEAAAAEARRRGYDVETETNRGGVASEFGREFVRHLLDSIGSNDEVPRCLVSGGETTVSSLVPGQPGKGGRNQEVALAAVQELLKRGWSDDGESGGIPRAASGRDVTAAIVSGGTDGEDGPTDAAGAVVDAALMRHVRAEKLDPTIWLEEHNSYRFFEQTGGLLITGPTHTNVMDLRVGLAVVRGGGER